MHFFVRKRRQTPTVIIVALIDVLIVLLIFLTVTTTFRQQSALRLALPESSQAKRTGANEAAPVVISIDTNGMFHLDKLVLTTEALKSELKKQAANNPQLKLAINADTKAPFGRIVEVMDAAKEANIKTVNAFTKEPAKQ